MGFNEENAHPAWMIIKNLPVAPPPVRPSVATTARSEDDLTHAYFEIIKMNNKLQSQLNKGGTESTIKDLRECIQYYVATLMDNEIQGIIPQKQKSGRSLKAIRARLRGKEGRMRGNLMGKRVDFSARTVITPDPNLQLDQLGVPRMIAGNLTIPERVTSHNLQEMRKLVENGPTTWPGAKYIIRDDERQIDLSQLTNRSDCQLEVGYIVERHLRDNDYVLFNRQPSLHKMSIMGHRVKVLPFMTFRLNLSVTSPYNADFDGDEMNMHVPQSYETMAEIKEIMHVPKQIVSPQSNKPVMGIVQDSLVGVMRMTLKDTFVEARVVMDIMMWVDSIWGDSSSGSVKIPPPAIIKPKPLWTGKQLLSLVIPKINFCRYGGDDNEFKMWDWMSSKDETNKDNTVFIKNGDLLCGVITKSSVGASPGGIIHTIWKDHGPYACRDFLSNVQKVVNNWLVNTGFTVGVSDIIATDEVMAEVKKIISEHTKCVQKIVQKTQLGKLALVPGKSMMETFEVKVNEQLNQARDRAGKLAFTKLSKDNRLRNMVFAGSKGGPINISQIMACVGQQNVEGKRIPFGFNKRSLPHFSKDDFGPESKGFVENSYLLGLTPQEFFFHAMGGREGLIDTAVKTSETGYIQRRLIKALEDVMVKYDGTVRNSHEHIVQFLYGEDAMAGEHIEDMFFSILLKSDSDLKKMCCLVPDKDIPPALEAELCRSMEKHVVQALREDVQTLIDLEDEF
jgi:DNA-directed RNA polymerase II subunit RPB1